jgi:heme oxygenase
MNENIKEIHDEVERMPFSQALFNGELTDHQIVAYMCNQWFIFQTMEDDVYRSLPHKSMKRCEKIKECVEEMGFEIDGKWMAKATQDYMDYIRGAEDYDEKWNSHVYLNYMAMLMGGSIISEKNPTMTWMWHFDDRTECIKSIRELDIDWDQVYQGFNYHRRMLEELNNVG